MNRVPTYLSDNVRDVEEGDYLSVDIQSKKGNTLFEVYYYGGLLGIKDRKYPFIVDNYEDEMAIPCKIVAKDIETGE